MTKTKTDPIDVSERPVVAVWRAEAAVLGFKMHRTTPHIGFLIASRLLLGQLDTYWELEDSQADHAGLILGDDQQLPRDWEVALITFTERAPVLSFPCELPSYALLIEAGLYIQQAGMFEMQMEFGQKFQKAMQESLKNAAILNQIGMGPKPGIVMP